MRRHPGAIKRQQRSMARARVALRGLRRSMAAAYPLGWPKCACGQPVLDGHLTCGQVACDELAARRARGES